MPLDKKREQDLQRFRERVQNILSWGKMKPEQGVEVD